MSKTIRKREPKKPRNLEVMNMLLNCKGGPMKDRREKRANEPENYRAEYDDDIECEEDF